MINKNNELPSFVNETNLPKIVDKLSNASNIKITGNKYGNRVQTVIDKIVEKADDVTKAIKQEVVNDSYSFKIGTGNVDVSADVEDGFGEMGIKGVTYQNCLKFTDDITFNLNLENWNIRAISSDKILVKPNTVYTMIIYVLNVTVSHNELLWVGDVSGNKNSITDEIIRKNVTMGINTFKFTTNSNPEDKAIRFQGSKFVEGVLTFKPLLLEGDHTNNPNLPSYFEGIVGIGDKSKNLFNYKLHDSIEYNGSYYTVVKERWKSNTVEYTVEPNTDYTISVDRCEGNLWLAFDVDGVQFNNNNYSKFSKVIRTNETGKLLLRVGANTSADVGHKFINLQLEKGTVVTTYESHHDGHKIEILSNGKNLVKPTITYNNNKFDTVLVSTINQCLYLNGIKEQGKSPGDSLFTKSTDYFYLKPNTKYIVSRKIFSGESNLCMLAFRLENVTTGTIQWLNTGSGENCVINASSDIRRVSYFRIYHNPDLKIEYKNVVVGAMMEEVKEQQTTHSNYEPYQEDKTQILLDEPLMRLPNGVCDEITRDGKLIRRVGKIIFTGIESWKTAIHNNKSRFDLSLNGVKTPSTWSDTAVPNMICSNLNVQTFKQIYTQGKSGINYYHANSDRLIVASLGNSCSLVEFKQWLSQNPTTVYYELAEPIITELPAPYLRIFKDGHLTFNTLVAPESNHVVQLNKSGQIQNAIKESQFLDNRINVLENNYDNLMLSTISRLNDLELDYTLK